MNENKIIKYALLTLFFKDLSISIPLIFLDVPLLIISIVSGIIILSVFIGSEVFSFVLLQIYNVARPIIYIIALIGTIKGTQDFIAIAFYIILAVQIPSMIKNLIFFFSSFK